MFVRKIFLFFGFILPIFLLLVMLTMQNVSATEEVSGDAREAMLEGIEVCLQDTWNDACYADLCTYEPGYLCAEELSDVAVEVAGPARAMEVLHDIMASPVFAITADGHLLSHVIGRTTSRVFGSSGENFLRCPHDFNDGCYHGFFEDTLVKVDDPVTVAISICEDMPSETTSDKERSYCYHGAGHVFLMNENYNLDASIDACTAVPDQWHTVCLSGVFMENAWPTRAWEEKSNNFRKDDPLYPCNALDADFRPTCYMEHYGYLMHEHTTSFDGLVAICLQAGNHTADCLSGIGLMLQNAQRTNIVFDSFGITDRPYMEKVIFLCSEFPDGYKASCYIPLVGALLNFDYPSMHRVSTFCGSIEMRHRAACFKQAGSYLNHLGSEEVKQSACAEVPATYQQDCLDPYARHTEVVISDFEESATTTMNRVIVDDVDQNDYLLTKVKDFFVTFFRHLSALFAGPVSAQSVKDSVDAPDTSFFAIERCISQQDGRAECYASLCEYEPGYLCAEKIVETAVEHNGPELGMQILREIIPSASFSFSSADEGHGLAHVVGRKTAKRFNGSGEAFLRCPTSFDSGCHHGFLEVALVEAQSPAEAVKQICETLPDQPSLDKVNCYHGAGHGILMNTSYDLYEALDICKALPQPFTCFSGVTMENVDAFVSGRIQEIYTENNSFDENNPHAPCDTLVEDGEGYGYRDICYETHLPYLAWYFDYDIQGVVDTCLDAGEEAESCAHGVGGYGMYKEIQEKLMPHIEGNFIDKTIYLCNHFPEKYRETCYLWAINQSFIFYGAKKTSEFCVKIDKKYERNCYREMGRRLQDMVVHEEEKTEKCVDVPDEYRNECLFGYRLDNNVSADIQHDEGVYGELPVTKIEKERNPVSLFKKITQSILDAVKSAVSAVTSPASAQDWQEHLQEEKFNKNLFDSAQECAALDVGRAGCYASLCEYEPGYLCAEEIVTQLVFGSGPKESIRALHDMTWGGEFLFEPSSAHQITHTIGRSTGEKFGLTGEAFLKCPIDFDYGCHHGFFEAGLAVVPSPAEFIENTCSNMPDTPPYAKTACYHGSGHALVMNYSYGLYKPLEQCDLLEREHRKWDCYSGVFMENVSGAQGRKTNDEIDNGFRTEDPFAPCNNINERYKTLCYQSQVSYWLYALQWDLKKIIDMCNKVEDGYVQDCVYNLGAQSIYSSIQDMLLGDSISGNLIDKTIFICNQFSEEYHMRCYEPAIDQNFTYYGIENTKEFCGKLNERYRSRCWKVIGRNIGGKVKDETDLYKFCNQVPEIYYNDCLHPYHNGEEGVTFAAEWTASTDEVSRINEEEYEDHPNLFSRAVRYLINMFKK